MHVEAFMLFQPRLHFWMLVRGVVVDDQMQLKMPGRFSIDLLEKLQPLLMPMLALNAADQMPLKIIQRGEQGNGAMADIIVRLRADMPDSQRQSRLSAFEGLNLAFFIATEHQCLIRRIQIQPNDVPKFLFEVWIVGQFEGACQVRFYVVGGPYTLDAGR